MEERSETRRLPRGERCSQCGDRKHYLENGMRFCASNGHEIEGFIQFDVTEEEDAGRLGSVARREKEIREKETRQLTGLEGKSLYLEALQLVLRSQTLWLIREKGHAEELETVVRDLWDLRIRAFGSMVVVPDNEEEGEPQLEMFSSQPTFVEDMADGNGNGDDDDVNDDGTIRLRSRLLNWDHDRGASDWPMPRLVDTISLCYLGCLLLRIPTRVGEMHRWAVGGNMPYKRVYYNLPQEMQDRMPSSYIRALKMPLHTSLDGGILHGSVLRLALGYKYNYNIIFPPLNHISMLVQYGRQLSLPLESIEAARSLAEILRCSFQFPTSKSRIFPVDMPETLVASLMVVATKILFPFQQGTQTTQEHSASIISPLRFDWNKWIQAIQKFQDEHDGGQAAGPKPNFSNMTADSVVNMTTKELDDYLAHMSSFIDKTNANPITQFFPVQQPPPPEPPAPETSNGIIDQRTRAILSAAMDRTVAQDGEGDAPEEVMHEVFRTVEDLSPMAMSFYTVISDITGVPLEGLVRAVYMLELRIVRVWQRRSGRLNILDVQ